MSRFDQALESFGERINPILVRDVRRAMKGQLFVISFMSVLLFAVMGTVMVLVSLWRESHGGLTALGDLTSDFSFSGSDGMPAQVLFGGLYLLLSVAVTGVVPLLAFFSMSAERDESTLDLLSLASLRPGSIVRGKLYSLALQALLFYAAITPFLAVCFLMRGLSIEVFLISMLLSFVLCCALTSIGLLLSCLRVPKVGRLALLVFFGLLAYGANMALVFSMGMIAQNPGFMAQPEFRITCVSLGAFAIYLGSFSLAFAPGQLAHAEENRSTVPRIATTVVVVLFVFGNYLTQKLHVQHQVRFVLQWFCFYLLTLPLVFFVSEPETLGRRTKMRLKRTGRVSLLFTPWLPGGGRGMIFAILHIALLLFAGPYLDPTWGTASLLAPSTSTLVLPTFGYLGAVQGFEITALYLLLFLGLGPALFSPWTKKPLVRVVSGLSVPLLAFLAFLVMTLVRAAELGISNPELNWANPFLVPIRVFDSTTYGALTPVTTVVLSGAGIVLVLNAKRMISGLLEVYSASSAVRSSPVVLPEGTEGAGA